MIKEHLLEYLHGLYPLSTELRQHLYNILKVKELKRREYLLQAGKISEHVYFITEGLVRAYYLKDGKEICSWFMKERDVVFSVESFYGQQPSYESIQCLEPSVFYYISFQELQYIYKNFIEFNYIRGLLTEKYYALSEQRLRSMRMQKSKERVEFLLTQHGDLINRVPRKYLATYLGVTEETLSRAWNSRG